MPKILIFGATGGIGRQMAQDLTDKGQALHLVGRPDSQVAELATSLGASYSHAEAKDTDSLIQAIGGADDGSGIAGLVWAIGSILLKPLAALGEEDFIETYRLNVSAPAMAIKAAKNGLKKAQGGVVLFSSVAASSGFTNHAAIAAAKAGVEGLGRSLAAELAPDIRVNVIAPSLSDTKMAAPLLASEAMAKGIAQMHPLGRIGSARDISPLACLLLDNAASSWITGEVFAIDGGRGNLATTGRSK
jgi:NAD(P)-dependent dehydrogenase (short-subunit alcohol dehydrogenase family)